MSSTRAEMRFEDLEEALEIERLCQIAVGALLPQPLHPRRRCVRTQDHDRNASGTGIATELRQDLVACEVGKVKVEEDEIRQVLACQIEPELALHCDE